MKRIHVLFLIVFSIIIFSGCGDQTVPSSPEISNIDSTRPSFPKYSTYDSMDTAIVESVDTEEKTITLLNFSLNRTYTLVYTDLTVFLDRFGQALSAAQIKVGDIVDISFLKYDKTLVTLKHSVDAFSYDSLSKYIIDGERMMAIIGDNNYRLASNIIVMSENRRIDISEIIDRDIITVRGIDRDIWSIVVQKGHGYLKLANDIYAIGGWIEIGQNIIQRVSDNMLLVVPEGTFDVQITARGFSATKRVTIERNRETVIDLGDVEVETPRTGRVLFNVTPLNAMVFVDGNEVDIRSAVELEFGIYQVVCLAPGYDTMTLHIRISEEVASISITMDKEGTSSDNDSTPSHNPPIGIGSNRVYIDAPLDVEVYQDGTYMGIAPVFFEKMPGSRTITLRRQGFIPKSYQIHLDNEPTDVTFSFSELEPIVAETENSGSGNGEN